MIACWLIVTSPREMRRQTIIGAHWEGVNRGRGWVESGRDARRPLRDLLQRHAVPGGRSRGGRTARAPGLRGRLPARADVLRADARQLRLRARGGPAARALPARVRGL